MINEALPSDQNNGFLEIDSINRTRCGKARDSLERKKADGEQYTTIKDRRSLGHVSERQPREMRDRRFVHTLNVSAEFLQRSDAIRLLAHVT